MIHENLEGLFAVLSEVERSRWVEFAELLGGPDMPDDFAEPVRVAKDDPFDALRDQLARYLTYTYIDWKDHPEDILHRLAADAYVDYPYHGHYGGFPSWSDALIQKTADLGSGDAAVAFLREFGERCMNETGVALVSLDLNADGWGLAFVPSERLDPISAAANAVGHSITVVRNDGQF
ncbi:hypothetical protein ACFXO9_31660 [Nocardia tengchongensis]|uniref:DUF6630 family protein n=1 Tax=Nocardia tengchongensis TaxID=2055889 RepID=UPI0036C98920